MIHLFSEASWTSSPFPGDSSETSLSLSLMSSNRAFVDFYGLSLSFSLFGVDLPETSIPSPIHFSSLSLILFFGPLISGHHDRETCHLSFLIVAFPTKFFPPPLA